MWVHIHSCDLCISMIYLEKDTETGNSGYLWEGELSAVEKGGKEIWHCSFFLQMI